jgi:hypothetical protein
VSKFLGFFVCFIFQTFLLRSVFQAKHVGEVISVVAHQGAFLDSKNRLISAVHAVFVRRSGMTGSPSRLLAGAPNPNYSWRYVLGLSQMLRDPSISETGSSDYFRLSLILSCVISQSQSTATPVHVLAVGDVLQDADRMMTALISSCVSTVFLPPSLHQMLNSALKLTARGVCRVQDLTELVARNASLCNKLVEFLISATASNCGTIWGSLSSFNIKASESPIEKDFPLLARTGLSRCFSLIHRCTTPSPSAVTELQRQREDDGSSLIEFEPQVMREAVLRAVAHLDSCSISATPLATRLMEGFVHVSRRLRNQLSNEVSIHAIGLLFVLARAHAALCVRKEVTEEDATIAIYLLEESLLCKTGKSILGFSPFLGSGKANLSMYADLKELHSHIQRLLKSHIPEH